MKNQHIILLPLVVLNLFQILEAKPGGQRRKDKQPAAIMTTYVPRQQMAIDTSLDETKTLPTIITNMPSVTALPSDQETQDLDNAYETIRTPQVPLGSLDKEINKGWLARIISSRSVRSSAERIMNNYDPQTHLLGSGDPEETRRLFDETIDSYIYHSEPFKLAAVLAFLTKNNVPSEKLSSEHVQNCLKTQQKILENQRKTLEPHVAEAQELAEKEQNLVKVLALLQSK
jgi:hypothetical protein